MSAPAALDRSGIRAILCDADGNLFPSEEHAFVPSTAIVNDFLAENGQPDRYRSEDLRHATTGMNFRSTIQRLARSRGIVLDDESLERLVAREREDVTSHLARVLGPDDRVRAALERLSAHFRLAAVSSSATARLDACFAATGLDDLIPAGARFSAEDSLPTPRSKPDPAVYLHSLAELGLDAGEVVAVEDAAPGVASAAGAGIAVVGNLAFVPPEERRNRDAELREAGAVAIVSSWEQLTALLEPDPDRALAARG